MTTVFSDEILEEDLHRYGIWSPCEMQSQNSVFKWFVGDEEECLHPSDSYSGLIHGEDLDALSSQPKQFVEALVRTNVLVPIPDCLVSPLDEGLDGSRACSEG